MFCSCSSGSCGRLPHVRALEQRHAAHVHHVRGDFSCAPSPSPLFVLNFCDALQISQHKSDVSAWVVAHGEVYDATAFLSTHPAGRNRPLPPTPFSTAFAARIRRV